MSHSSACRRCDYAPARFAVAVAVLFAIALPSAHALPIIGVGGGGVGGGGGAPATGTPPLNLVSHTGTSSSMAKAGIHALDTETDSPTSLLDTDVSTSASSGPIVGGTGTGINVVSATASTSDSMSTAGGQNTFSFGLSTIFGPGTAAEDGSARAEMSAVWNLTFAVERIDFTYSVSRLLLGAGGSSSSSLTVRNATTGAEILSLTDPVSMLPTTLTIFGDVGDTLEIAVSGFNAYDVSGAASSLFNTLNYSLGFAAHVDTVPEPLTSTLVIVGLLALRHQRPAVARSAF